MFMWFHQHDHSVVYNNTKYQNVVLTQSGCSDGVNETQRIKMCVSRGRKIRRWNQ